MDTIVKTIKEKPVVEDRQVESKNETGTPIDDKVDVPYLDAKNFLDSYFGLGTEWHDRDANFYPEVETIDKYIKGKIDDGEIGNNQSAVKELLSKMEMMNNLSEEKRSVVKLEVLANYVEFLMKNDNLKSKLKRYAN